MVGGGGLVNDRGSTTTLTNCTVSGNFAAVQGGGLFNYDGTTTLTNCTVSGNSASTNGGGLFTFSGTTTLTDCTVSGNSATGNGGGLDAAFEDRTTLTNCTISGNSAGGNGGGLYGNVFTATTLTNCTVSGNSAGGNGGGLYSQTYSPTTLTNCTVSGNSAAGNGGGLYDYYSTTTLTNCTVSGNSAGRDGGGLYSHYYSTTTLTNCTVSGNSAGGNGGGLFSDDYSPTTLTNCTVSGNSASVNGGGLFNGASNSATLANTIVAGNTAVTGPDGAGGFTSQGNNLIGETDGSSGWVGSDLTGTIAPPLNPLLAPLGNYGGPTQTMALLPGSPAIDAGNNALIPAGVTTDQRGLPRIVNTRRGHRRLRVEWVHHRRHFGKRPVHGRAHGLPGPAGRDGHRQQSQRARGGGPGHIHPAGERGVGDPQWKPGDHQRHRHGERHGHGQRHRRQLQRHGHGQRHHDPRELQPEQPPVDHRPRPVGERSTEPLGSTRASTHRVLSMSIPARRVPSRPAATPRSRPRPSMSSAASRRGQRQPQPGPGHGGPGPLRGLAAVTEHRGDDQLWFLQPGREFVRDDPAGHLQQHQRLGNAKLTMAPASTSSRAAASPCPARPASPAPG